MTNKPFDIDTLDISLAKSVIRGEMSVEEAAREFCAAGWTNYIDEDFAQRKVDEYRKGVQA